MAKSNSKRWAWWAAWLASTAITSWYGLPLFASQFGIETVLSIPVVMPIAIGCGIIVLFLNDITQVNNPIQRTFPVLYWGRKIAVGVGPLFRQYWFMADLDEKPFNRVTRNWVYKTAAGKSNNIGFGSQIDFDAVGSYHVLPSTFTDRSASGKNTDDEGHYQLVIGKHTGVTNPVVMDHFVNISAMSFGSLSARAISALNIGAKKAGIFHNTGEGGYSPYHQKGGGAIFQMGTAKFGVRKDDSSLDDDLMKKLAAHSDVKMIEVKLAQGAKPGKGGMLLKEKITAEIAAIRNVPMGQDLLSPRRHVEISNVDELFDFLDRVRKICDKPVGIKLVVGHTDEIEMIAEKMAAEPGRGPDYIAVDGSEGGTGAAPLVLASHAGLPMKQAIAVVDIALKEYGVRDRVALLSAGQMATPIDVVVAMSLGADAVYIARGFLLALGCIQALDCHSNHCPTGIATQDAKRQRALDVEGASERVAMYAQALQHEVMTLTKSCGYTSPSQFTADDVMVVTRPGHLDYLSELQGVSAWEAAQERKQANAEGMTVGEWKRSKS
jgi:glutamate synthase domain-containing protein 2